MQTRDRSGLEVCFGQTEPEVLVNTQGLSPEVAGCLWTPAHHLRGLGAREISPPHALGMN